jgi:hypothetical protein
LGRRLTSEERGQIKSLVSEGLKNREIAERLDRSEAAVRNIRYRENLKTETANQLPELTRQRRQLQSEVAQLTQRRNILLAENRGIQTRSDQTSKTLQLDEETLKTRIQSTLTELKWRQPQLFFITGQEQLNRLTTELTRARLRKYSVRFAPTNLYMSVLNWLTPERVGEKSQANHAYPIGGEYVVDVDHYLNYRPHSHRTTDEGVCEGCLENSKEISLRLLDTMRINYSRFEVVFSGRRGFHLHVLDFDVKDWTTYNELNPIKSHEVARFVYTKYLKQVCGGFDDDHFKVSVDPMRVVTFPESINGESGLLCKSLGGIADFEAWTISRILIESRWTRIFNYPIKWHNLSLEDYILRSFQELEASYPTHLESKLRL